MVCRVASLSDVVVFGFSCQADETTVASQIYAPEKEPTTKQQIGMWLVGGGGSLAIVTIGWDMWRHRQEQERVKNIIVNASSKHASHVSRLNGR